MNNVTLKQVAELSGKSEATVSLVLNSRQYHRVSPRTRQLIQSIAEKLGYIPNMQAQALVKGRTRNIAVTANGLTPFYNEYIRRITHLLEARNYNVFAFETMLSPNRERQVVNWVRQGLFDGCICLEYNHYTREFYEPAIRAGIPYVLRGWDMPEECPAHMIRVDYRSAVGELFRHLAAEGWRRFGVITDGSSYCEEATAMSVRSTLYAEAAENSGVALDPDGWIVVPFDAERHLCYIYEHSRALFRNRPDIDGVIVQSSSDIPAVFKAAADSGRRIRTDLAIATFDQIPLIEFMQPPVRCIVEPSDEISQMAVDGLLAQLTGTESGPVDFSRPVGTRLVINDSTVRNRSPGPPDAAPGRSKQTSSQPS